jgi:uncharacterized repeat protein (TIGR01451 family)
MKTLVATCLIFGSAAGVSAADVDVNLGTLPPGKTVTIRFRATVNGPLPSGVTSVQNQGSVSGTNLSTVLTDDPDTGTPGDPTLTTVVAAPDLSLTKTDGVSFALPGGTLTYSLGIGNVGNQDATGVFVTETVPPGTTFESTGSSPGWSCPDGAPANTVCLLTVGGLPAGMTVVRTFVVNADNPLPPAQISIVNTATVTDDLFNGGDPNGANNSATDIDTLGTDLQMTKTDSPDPVAAGSSISYALSAINAGPGPADAVSVTDTLPANTVFASVSAPAGWICNTPAAGTAGTVTCTKPTLAVGTETITLVVGVNLGTANGTIITNSATITSTTADTSTGNETGVATTTVQAPATAPAAATLSGPTGTVSTSNPTYIWNAAARATEYLLWVSQGGVVIQTWYPSWQVCGANPTCSVTPATALANGNHTWWIQTRNSVGSGLWSAGMSFNVNAPLAGAPVLVGPNGTITNTATPTYVWQPVAGALDYLLWVNRGALNVVQQTFLPGACAATCTATPGTVLPDDSYRFWVQARTASGPGPWSLPMDFTIDAAPNPPTLIAPSGMQSTQTPTYVWNGLAGATDYQLYVADPSGTIVVQTWHSAGVACVAGTCQVTPSTPLGSGTHQVWLRAGNGGSPGAWSNGLAFTISAQPPAPPVLTGPTGAVVGNQTYTWQASAGATDYQLSVQSPTGAVVVQNWFSAAAICTGGNCAVTPVANLTDGMHSFWVQGKNCLGTGGWSSGMAFTVSGGVVLPPPTGLPGMPATVTPTGTITASMPTYNWTASAQAVDYLLSVRDNAGAVQLMTWYSGPAVCAGANCSISPPRTLANGSYLWSVQARNGMGMGMASADRAFMVNAPVMVATLTAPTGAIGTNLPTFQWNAAASATDYFLQVNNASGNPVFQSWFAASAVCSGGACSINPQMPFMGGSYSWFVKARNCDGPGPWSTSLTFVTP